MTTSTDTPAARGLHTILHGIAADYSGQVARDAALTLRTAIVEGRIDGCTFGTFIGSWSGCGCVIGQLCHALDADPLDGLPGWSMMDTDESPVERLVGLVRPGDLPETEPALADLLAIVDAWLEQGEAVPA